MKRNYFFQFFTLILLPISAFCQDVGVEDILTQNSGCDLGYPQMVSIKIRNHSNIDINLPINVSYQLNSLTVVSESATLAIGAGGTTNYTFSVPINSGFNPDTNIIVARASNELDFDSTNNRWIKTFFNHEKTIGGKVVGDSQFCDTVNQGSLLAKDFKGSIQYWQKSFNNGASWSNITWTSPSMPYNNENQTTIYRVAVKNGTCDLEFAQAATITVVGKPIKPFLETNSPVCEGADLELFGTSNDGVSFQWEGPNGYTSNLFNPKINNVDLNAAGTYKLVVSKQGCASDTASINIRIDPKTIGGILLGDTTICADDNNGTIVLSNQLGSLIRWEYSENDGNDWLLLSDTTVVRPYEDLTKTRIYRALVKNETCTADYSGNATVVVNERAEGGQVLVDFENSKMVCQGSNLGWMTLSDSRGTIQKWEYSTSPGIWKTIPNTEPTLEYKNIFYPTTYRVIVEGCGSVDTSRAFVFHTSKEECERAIIANLLTPNGDGKNDTWMIDFADQKKSFEVSIFNRSGILVFHSKDYKNDWDGTLDGEELQDGTYYYILKVKENFETLKGSINLMR